MSEVLRRVMLLIMFILMLVVGAAAEGEGAPGKQEQLTEAKRLEEQVQKLHAAGKYAEAVPLAERGLQIRESVREKNHLDIGASLDSLASLYIAEGAYQKAEPLCRRALQIREVVLGKDHPDVAESLNRLAELYLKQGIYDKAEPLHLRALQICEAALGKNHLEVARTLNGLAVLYWAQGAYQKAEPLHLRALQIREAAPGKNHFAVAQSLSNLATLYDEQGVYDKAEPLYLRALQIQESALGKNHSKVALSLMNLGAMYSDQGAYNKAEPLYLRALQIDEVALGKNHPDVASEMSNLAVLYHRQGSDNKAEPLLLRVLQIRESVLRKSHPDIAFALTNLAGIYKSQGVYSKAEPLFLRALQIGETALGKNHPNVAVSIVNLADLYKSQGAYDKALPLFLRGLQIRESTLGKNHPAVARSLNALASLYQAQGDDQQANALRARAFRISEHTLRLVDLLTTESRLDSFLKTLQPDADTTYSLSPEIPQAPSAVHLALATALLRKGRSLDETALASREFSELHGSPAGSQDGADLAQLQALRHRIAKVLAQELGNMGPKQQAESLQSLEEQYEELEQKLTRRSSTLRQARDTPGTEAIVTRVSQALPKDSTLVEVVHYRPYQFRATGKMPPWGASRYRALVLSPGEVITAYDLGPATPIDKAVVSWLQQLADTHSQPQDYMPAAQALYQKIFAPLLSALQDRKQVFLSLDGQLQLVPFAALHDGTSFLLDRYHFTYLSSGRDLLRSAASRPKSPRMVVMANPDFMYIGTRPSPPLIATAPLVAQAAARGQRAQTMPLAMTGLRELPGTQKEADLLKRRFPRATILVREAATETALLGQHSPDVLHVATHGLIVVDGPVDATKTSLGSRGGWPIVKVSPPPSDKFPEVQPLWALSQSALMLAGAKAHRDEDRPDADDGLATALEVAGMDLRGTELVVLSACNTGLGEVTRGQGLYGFRRAFFIAGAETLVTSLWRVDDQATAELMDSFYAKLQKGAGRVAAMEEAMKATRVKREHPAYWAPFIVLGRGDPVRGLGASSRR